MRKGIHIITPNKKMNSGPLARYQALKAHQRNSFIHYFYEGTVGAGGWAVWHGAVGLRSRGEVCVCGGRSARPRRRHVRSPQPPLPRPAGAPAGLPALPCPHASRPGACRVRQARPS